MNKERNVDERGRELDKVTCADCGEEIQVPFKPVGSRPVYFQECYQKNWVKRY